ncbi:NADH:flavin oxidoreductase/NADH oxidase [Streptomyces harbinensis]|uniref:NADH:flavin oxidoreductase/NADH oxidase n=1 Tax=Streptomyces harbinensis TaxID=1176198 RepID=UPI0015918462|nr:NADH:flavin oxidoreductase/NADH oxidase [Streptomyces harbinensis]QKV68536.1 NADH:flavin oxidoreductase/NADH oxidase [Streptomyces harbinensis]
MSVLFTPLKLRSLQIPNRVWLSPMCMYSAADRGPDTGTPNDFHLSHLASRAAGGAGLIMVESTAVRPDGRISPWDLGLWNDRQQEAFTRVTRAITGHGAVPGIQLAHAGRKGSLDLPWRSQRYVTEAEGGWRTVAPSAVPFGPLPAPHALTVAEIGRLVDDFAAAARRARAAGFQVVEVHGAHGYLINSFLSPLGNHRTDAYGGDAARRSRFALEVVAAVRAEWPADLPVLFRTSATDWAPGGWDAEDTVRLAAELRRHGVDLLDVSTGGMAPDAGITTAPGYQVPFAAQARAATGIPTAAVGLITEPAQAERILAAGHADAVFLGRELLRNPYWPHHAALTLGAEPRWPDQYCYTVRDR